MLKKIRFYFFSKRIGPDMLFTHWMLHSTRLGRILCRAKFRNFGENSYVRPHVTCVSTEKISIGNNVTLRPFTMLFAEGFDKINIEIYDNVLIGSGVHIYVANHEFRDVGKLIIDQGHSISKKVVVKEGAWLGANAIILPGVTIGRNSVVGAGSIVTKDVPDYTVVAGNPAKIIKRLCHVV